MVASAEPKTERNARVCTKCCSFSFSPKWTVGIQRVLGKHYSPYSSSIEVRHENGVSSAPTCKHSRQSFILPLGARRGLRFTAEVHGGCFNSSDAPGDRASFHYPKHAQPSLCAS